MSHTNLNGSTCKMETMGGMIFFAKFSFLYIIFFLVTSVGRAWLVSEGTLVWRPSWKNWFVSQASDVGL